MSASFFRPLLFFSIMLVHTGLFAQKNVTPVQQTQLLGIKLPDGSKQDKRLLSVSLAKTIFETETTNAAVSLSKVEVYSVPPVTANRYNIDSLKKVLAEKKYQFTKAESDNKLAWAKSNSSNYIIYFANDKRETILYIGECSAAPAQTNTVQQTSPGNNTNNSTTAVQQQQKNNPSVNTSNNKGYTFTTSNFDDGWVATIQNDWVLVQKNNQSVYLYYAVTYNSDWFSGTGVMERDYYWDNYVAKQFRIERKQYKDDGEFVSSLKPKYVEGWGADPQTGERRFLAMTLSISPNAAQLTVAAYSDEQTFRSQFPKANDKYTSDLTNMHRYNKFAIGAGDVTGTWQSGGSQMTQWYDARTGNYAGATFASSSATFSFVGNGTYSSIHNGATGAVGAMNSFQQEYKGTYSISNWNIKATNRYQGRTDSFDAHFQAVRAGRLLYLNDQRGGSYLLVKIK